MTSASGEGGQPKPHTRPRAPTISIDDSALRSAPQSVRTPPQDRPIPLPRLQTDGFDDKPRTSSTFTASPTDARLPQVENAGSRPASAHNVSSPTSRFLDGAASQNFLAVPAPRSRGNSIDSDHGGHSPTSYGGDTFIPSVSGDGDDNSRSGSSVNNDDVISDAEALLADPGTENDFVENDKFAFSVGHLNKLINPKSLAAFYALGGLRGLEKGLRTDRRKGLSNDEAALDGHVSFEDAIKAGKDEPRPLQRRMTSGSLASHVEPPKGAFGDRIRVYKDNKLPEKKAKTIWELAWIAYNDKVLILLSVAAVISLGLGIYQSVQPVPGDTEAHVEWVEGVAIIVAILIVVVVGALNDYQKERQFVKLNKKKEERFVKVIRSGKAEEISVYDVLVGDVMLLEPGDIVPVDGIFIDGYNVKFDESSATGESDIIRKTPGDDVYYAIEHHESLRKMDPFILSGAKMSEGVGNFLVTSVGVNSSYGKTLMSLQDERQTTPLQSKLNVLAEYIAKLGLAAGLLLFVACFIKFLVQIHEISGGAQGKGQRFLQVFIVAVTIVVVAVPEGLPLAVTLALAFATTRMLRDNNLVRLLRACETMGNATTVCSDKTGTLTENKMSVVAGTIGTASRFGDKQVKAPGADDANSKVTSDSRPNDQDVSSTECMATLAPETKELLKDSIVLNSTAFEAEEDGKMVFVGSKTETALLTFGSDHLGITSVAEDRANAEVAQMVPFDSERKCMAMVIKLPNGKYRMLVKGASEILIEHCTRIIRDPTKGVTETTLTSDNRETLKSIVSNYANRSLRTIALLYKNYEQWPPRGAPVQKDDRKQVDFDKIFKDMTFLGLVGIQDPIRQGVTDAVHQCQVAGVFVRMVTGDNLMTAKAIATECGIYTPGGIAMEGPVFRKLGSKQLMQVLPRLQVLARSSPDDKKLLVSQLKKQGETVAVTGDGTNDAPALKTADVGFSMGIAGTEVAKEASAIILMDDNFASIVKAISWGRTVNDAVKKFLQASSPPCSDQVSLTLLKFQITVNITAVILTFISAVASNSETSVLTAVQLLWVNLIMDTFAALALATDPPSPSMLKRRPEPKSAPLITFTMWKMIIGQSIYQLVVTLILYFGGVTILSYQSSHEQMQLQTLVFNTFVWMQIFNQYNCRRLDNEWNVFEGVLKNYWFLSIQLIIIGGQVLIVFIGGQAFAVHRLNRAQWAYSLVLGFLAMPVAIIIRLIPDELIARFLPAWPFSKDTGPRLMLEGDEEAMRPWNPAIDEIREELAFLKRIRGGRMSDLAYTLQHPVETLLPRSRSTSRSRSRSNSDVPRTPTGEAESTELPKASPKSPDRPKRHRSTSNSAFGPAAAMAGIIAGSVAGGWSPVDRRHDGEGSSITFNRSRAHSGLSNSSGIEVHPGTKEDDPVIAETPLRSPVPPSQNPMLSPHFDHAPPPLTSPFSRGRKSHSRQSSVNPP